MSLADSYSSFEKCSMESARTAPAELSMSGTKTTSPFPTSSCSASSDAKGMFVAPTTHLVSPLSLRWAAAAWVMIPEEQQGTRTPCGASHQSW